MVFTTGDLMLVSWVNEPNAQLLHRDSVGAVIESLPRPANNTPTAVYSLMDGSFQGYQYVLPNRGFFPRQCVFDSLGRFVAADYSNVGTGDLVRYKADGTLDTTFNASAAGQRTNSQAIWNVMSGPTTARKYNSPASIDAFSDRRLAVGNQFKGSIFIIAENGSFISEMIVASRPVGEFSRGAVFLCIGADQKTIYYVDAYDGGDPILYAYDSQTLTQRPNVATIAGPNVTWISVRLTQGNTFLLHQQGVASPVGANDGLAVIYSLAGAVLASRKFSAYMDMDQYVVRTVTPDPLDYHNVWIGYIDGTDVVPGVTLKKVDLYTGTVVATVTAADVPAGTFSHLVVRNAVGVNAAVVPVSFVLGISTDTTTSYTNIFAIDLPRNATVDLNYAVFSTLDIENPSPTARMQTWLQFRVANGAVGVLLPTCPVDVPKASFITANPVALVRAPKGTPTNTVQVQLWAKSSGAVAQLEGRATDPDTTAQTALIAFAVP